MKVVLCSDREKSPSFMRLSNDQGWSSKEVPSKVEEPLKEHPKRKRPKSRSKSSNDRRTDEERSPPEKAIKIVEKMTLIEERRSWRKKIKIKSIRDIHLDYHLQAHLLMILMGVNIEAMRERKAQIPDLGWFLRISTNTTYLLMSHNTLRLILIIPSKRKP